MQRAALLVEQVRDVGERDAGAQAGGLRGGAHGDARVRLAGRAGPAAAGRLGAGDRGEARRRVLREERAGGEQASQSRRREVAGGPELPLVEAAGLVDELERGALPRAEPGRGLRRPGAACGPAA